MICPTCAQAADQHADRDQHCDSTGGPGAACCCQHRTDRYAAVPEGFDRLAATADEVLPRYVQGTVR